MPSRILRDSFVTSESVASIPTAAQDRLPRYFLLADDFGRFLAHPSVIRGRVWPLRPDVTEAIVTEDLAEFAKAGIIELYDAPDGKRYAWFPHWSEHQREPRPWSKPKCPAPASAEAPASSRKLPHPPASGIIRPQSQSQSQSQKKEPPIAPLEGGRAVRLPRLVKRNGRKTTLAEGVRSHEDAIRDERSKILAKKLQFETLSRPEQIAWVRQRWHASPVEAEDVVALVEHARNGVHGRARS